jgi:hypothetical protein
MIRGIASRALIPVNLTEAVKRRGKESFAAATDQRAKDLLLVYDRMAGMSCCDNMPVSIVCVQANQKPGRRNAT